MAGSTGSSTPDPAAAWQAVINTIANQPALGFLRHLAISRLDEHAAHLVALPGQRDMLKLVNPQRREQLAQLLAPILGRPIRVEIEPPPPSAPNPRQTTPPPPRPTTRPAPPPSTDKSAAPTPPAAPRFSQQQAFTLPLVKQIMDVFDVTLIDVRPEGQTNPIPPTESTPPPIADFSPPPPDRDPADDLDE